DIAAPANLRAIRPPATRQPGYRFRCSREQPRWLFPPRQRLRQWRQWSGSGLAPLLLKAAIGKSFRARPVSRARAPELRLLQAREQMLRSTLAQEPVQRQRPCRTPAARFRLEPAPWPLAPQRLPPQRPAVFL